MEPLALEDLIVAFAKLPGIGRKTAQRLALYVVKRPREEAELLAKSLIAAKDQIEHCATCYNFTQKGEPLCEVCRDTRRDQQFICVVAEASDVLAFEMSQFYSGAYHVLGGVLSPQDGVLPEDLHFDYLGRARAPARRTGGHARAQRQRRGRCHRSLYRPATHAADQGVAAGTRPAGGRGLGLGRQRHPLAGLCRPVFAVRYS